MHVLGQENYEEEHKTFRQQVFRPTIPAEMQKQTATRQTAQMRKRWHDLLTYRCDTG
jgi:hypothetical protein